MYPALETSGAHAFFADIPELLRSVLAGGVPLAASVVCRERVRLLPLSNLNYLFLITPMR